MFGSIGKTLLIVGGVMVLCGLVFLVIGKTGLGRLPGDILIKRENVTIFFPITTMIIVSVVLSIIFNFIRRF